MSFLVGKRNAQSDPGGYGRISLIKFLVCFAYSVNTLILWYVSIETSDVHTETRKSNIEGDKYSDESGADLDSDLSDDELTRQNL